MSSIEQYRTKKGEPRWKVRDTDGVNAKVFRTQEDADAELARRHALDPLRSPESAPEAAALLAARGTDWCTVLETARDSLLSILASPALSPRDRLTAMRTLAQLSASAGRHIDDREKRKALAALQQKFQQLVESQRFMGERV